MVMSIISAICAGGQVIYDSVAASDQSAFCKYVNSDYFHEDYQIGYPYGNTCEAVRKLQLCDNLHTGYEKKKKRILTV